MKTPRVDLPAIVAATDALYRLERFTPAMAANYLQIAIDRVYRETTAGRIGHLKDGRRRIRFSQADLDLWRQARRVEARDAATTRVRHARSVAASSSTLPVVKHRMFDPNRRAS